MRRCLATSVTMLWVACVSYAQQSTDMLTAVQPGRGVTLFQQMALYERLDDTRGNGFGSIDTTRFTTELTHGLSGELALKVGLPVVAYDIERSAPGEDASPLGIDDVPVLLQWRFLKRDTGAVDTLRGGLLVGAELPTFDDAFSSDSVDPLVGVAFTQIAGRHGVNLSALWKFNTGGTADFGIDFGDAGHDTLNLDASYLYRLTPEAYTADTAGSHYVQVQLLNHYEANGDIQTVFAPGYMDEARQWAVEATVHLPVYQQLDHRPELAWGLNVGVRLLF